MTSRLDLQEWVIRALKAHGGTGTIVQVARYIWANYRRELEASGDLFFTWQYDMRWACTRLRERKIVKPAEVSARGQWQLAS